MMRAIVLRKDGKAVSCRLEDVDLPSADEAGVVCSIAYSSLNYKDALAITNRGPVVRQWPMIPGIDGAGTIEHSAIPELPKGAEIVVTGWGLGETRWGCLAEAAFLPKAFPTKLPVGLSLRDAMAVGTAGFTAMLSVLAIERHGVRPQDGIVLVTGASGGVGGMALMFLKSLGYVTAASTGRPDEAAYLERAGASRIIDRRQLAEPGKPLQKEEWAAVIDCVGSFTLANACASTRYGGIVTACGLAQGMDLPATVAPFILRGVTLAGIDSVLVPQGLRGAVWERIAQVLDRADLDNMTREIGLSEAVAAAEELLAGRVRGRLIVDVRK